jgi:hypothetical protein
MPDELKIKTDYEIINAEGTGPSDIPIPLTQWIPAAKEGQVISLQDGLGVITREGLESSVGTWKNGNIFDNHKTLKAGFTIHGDKFISPYLYFLLDDIIVAHLGKSAGGSIDALAMKVDGNKVIGMKGVGYSVISPGLVPSCTKEAGCGIPIAGEVKLADIDTKWDFKNQDYSLEQLEIASAWKDITKPQEERTEEDYKLVYKQPDGKIVWRGVHAAMSILNRDQQDVNISREDRESVYDILSAAYKLFEKEPPELKQKSKVEIKNNGGSKRKMVDKIPEVKPEVTFSPTQVAEIKAAAIAEVTEQLGNAHKAGVADMEAIKAAELKTLGEAHTAELEAQREAVTKQVGMVEALATQYSLSEEAKKALSDAKTLEDALALFAGLTITKPIAGKGAAEGGKEDKGGGVIEGAGKIEAKAPETVKIEEVGNFNPYTKKYEPTYREELK